MKYQYYDQLEHSNGLFAINERGIAIAQRSNASEWKSWIVLQLYNDLLDYFENPKPARCVIDDYGTLVKVGEGW